MTSPTTSSTVTQVSLSSTSTINALLGGSKWGGTVGSGVSISYSFPWQSGISSAFAGFNGSGSYSSLNEPNATQHYGLEATQITAVQLALQSWGSVANISFNQVADNSTTVGDIRFAFTSATELTSTGQPAWGWAYFPTSNAPASGDIWLSSTATAATNPDWSIGSQNYSSMMHELGHALGLKHTFEGGVTLSLAEDTEQYSIMSYTSAAKSLYVKVTQSGGGWSWSSYHITPSTPMLYDMRAIQYLYGANTSYNTGDNTYTFDPAAPFIKTIWDAAGNDTISVSNFTLGCAIDLRQGHYSKISYFDDTSAPVTWSTPPPTPTFDGTDDLAIAFGCLIENATGGSGSDTLHGNDSDNTLNGGAGNDTLIGEGGNDNLIGGGGTDTVAYSGLRSQYVATALINGSYTVSGPNGVDTLSGITFVQFSDRTDTLSNLTVNVLPTGAVTINGNATQGQTLTASNSLADADGMGVVTYQWKAAGVAINGATASTLTLAEAQVGKAITVTASYTDGHGNAESMTSNATSLVINVNDNPTGGVPISGTTTQGQTLTAFNSLTDADGMGVVTYQWLAAGVAISGATANTLTLAKAQVGKAIGVTASYTDGHGTPESATSIATALVTNLNDAPSGGVTVAGTALQGQTLTVTNSLADADGMGVVSYQWKAAGIAIGGATASTLTLTEAQVGKVIAVTASYTDGHGTAESMTSSVTGFVANLNDAPTGGVTITGVTTQGQTLSAVSTLADLDGMGAITYQWKTDGISIGSPTTSTLTLTEAQVGKAISVTASYTDGHGTPESATSSATDLVTNLNDAPSGGVTVAGSAIQGQTLTVTNSLADADGMGVVSYQWKAAGIAIGGATASTLTLTEAQVGKAITVTASYTDGHGTPESATSSATAFVANLNDAPTGGVTITGVTTQGQSLSAVSTLADLDGMGAITYQWKTDGIPIGSPTTSTLVLTEALVGKAISVTASYTDGHGTPESSSSSTTALVANLNDAPSGSVTVAGTALQGQTLTAINSLADLDGMGTIAYQWRVDGVPISSLATSTLVLTEAQVGKAIGVTASYTDGHGTPESATSSTTALVTNLNDSPSGGVTVAGTALQGQTLTVTSSLADLDGLGVITYQWKANGTLIASATASTLVLTEAQVGKAISATASYTDGHGTAESATRNAPGLVANLNDAPTGGVTFTGTALQGQSLSVVNNLADLDGLGTMSYQWRANGDPITGGTGSTFKLTETQVGKAISVTSSYTDGHGTAESVSSAAGAAVANLNDLPTGEVTIAGTVTQGQTLSASNTVADLDGLGAMSYQWKANGSAIDNALSNTLILTEDQVGKFITITANYLDGHGTPESVTSTPTAVVINVNDAPTGTVTIAGTPTQGQALSANSTLVDLDGLGTVFYQWQANDLSIADASSSSLVLTEAQVGKTISVTASFVDRHGTVERVTSAASTPVANLNDAPTGGVSISGTATQGQTLSASNTLADLDGLGAVTYQWNANETALVGATGNSLALTQALVGKTITATARYTDGHGALESKTSASSGSVANTNDAPTGSVLIAGTPTVGQTLTVTNTLADVDGLGTLGYQWAANGIAIEGATASTFNLSENQLGKMLTVTISYTDWFGMLESVSTGPTASIASIPAQNRTGTPANDMLTGGLGNDTIDGKAGTDTAVYTARVAAYTISPTVISGPDGSDTLTGIERLEFLDANLAFDLDGNAGQTYRLYQASFNRTPDLAGLGGWIAAMDNGTTPVQVATSFMASAEFQSLYGANPTNEQFVSLLFTNALHRTADAGGLAYWVNQLTSNLQTRAQALVNLSESAENKASILPAIANGIVYATATQAAGPAKGQSFSGTSGDDSLIGIVGNDTFSAGAGNDTIIAGFGNDTITGGIGNDTINGGGGLDAAVYGGARASYSAANTDEVLTVSGGTDGTDALTNVERLKFDDAILAFDTSGNAGQTYRLYQAAFNRTPDKVGLSGWVNGVDSGMAMLKVAAAFIESGEFKTLYGSSPTDSEFVNLLYTNALHRAPDTDGLNYWVNQLSSHSQTRDQALLGFSESTENQTALIGVIQNGIELAVG